MSDKAAPRTVCDYQQAGVSIDAAKALVQRIKPIAARTRRPEVRASIGGFAALFDLPIDRYQQPVLVSATDGVGTKLKLALDAQNFSGLGLDLVAMCINDLIVCGAEPLFFLDYYATGTLSVNVAEQIISSIGDGCEQAGMSLIGGETAEMPGLYHNGDFDLAGFCVGVVEQANIIDGNQVKPGDALIGIAASGPHANGFSLIRHLLSQHNIDLQQTFGESKLIDALLTPTRIYASTIRSLQETISIHALAHITGGGLIENLPRVLPNYTKAVLDSSSWQQPTIFSWLQKLGNLSQATMLNTFNCGLGMVACVPQNQTAKCLESLRCLGEQAWYIGNIDSHTQSQPIVDIKL